MVRSVILPSQLLQSKMSLWWEVVSCQVNFLKVRCGHGEIGYPAMSTSWNTMLPWWVILSWQVNFFKVRCCHGEKCYLAKSIFIVKMLPYLWYYVVMFWKIIWLSRQVEWHLYASIVFPSFPLVVAKIKFPTTHPRGRVVVQKWVYLGIGATHAIPPSKVCCFVLFCFCFLFLYPQTYFSCFNYSLWETLATDPVKIRCS